MNKAFYIFFLFISISTSAQTNLIYNGDFEIYDTCPSQVSGPGDYQIEHALGWNSPTLATSDFFNTCSSNINQYINVDVPGNFVGFQFPYSGNGYGGFYPFVNWGNFKEYLQGELTTPLTNGKVYNLKFKLSLADSSQYAIANIGFCFTNSLVLQSDEKPIYLSYFNTNPNLIINEKNNWIEVNGYFTANGGEKNIIIGNFEDSNLVSKLDLGILSSTGAGTAYYYIDAISLVESDSISIPNIFSPNYDGINDIFKIENAWGETEMHIYNRWGESVNRLFGMNCYWDGHTTAGIECPEGVYYYIIIIEEKIIKGFVHLVR